MLFSNGCCSIVHRDILWIGLSKKLLLRCCFHLDVVQLWTLLFIKTTHLKMMLSIGWCSIVGLVLLCMGVFKKPLLGCCAQLDVVQLLTVFYCGWDYSKSSSQDGVLNWMLFNCGPCSTVDMFIKKTPLRMLFSIG